MPGRASHSLGRERRLRKRRDFERVQGGSHRVVAPHFIFLLAPQPQPGPARLGLVVTRKLGGAVVRNRIKRLCRECFRREELLPPGVDLVVIARSGAEKLGLAGVQAEWASVRALLAKPLPAERQASRGRHRRDAAR